MGKNLPSSYWGGSMSELTKRKPSVWKALRSQVGVQDSLFISFVVLLSVILYVPALGFYSDDWGGLGHLSRLEDRSLLGLIRSYYLESPNLWPRPVQAIYMVVLYWLFGLHPLGYHCINAAVLMSGIVLFYWVLQELNQNRLLALAVPMVYGLLPHYSTDRFWYAAFQANLSMALYFLSLYCDLRMLKARQNHLWGWKLLCIASLIGSTLAYEVFLPLFIVNPLIVWYRQQQLDSSVSGSKIGHKKLAVLLGSTLLSLMLVVIFKMLTQNRISSFPALIDLLKKAIKAPIALHSGHYGFGLPRVIWKILWTYPNGAIFILAGLLSVIIFGYLYQVASQSKVELPRGSNMLKLIGLGLAIASLSYGFFVDSWKFTLTGIDNRIAIAAAVGVAFSLVGLLGWLSNLLNSSYSRQRFFCLLIALLCMSGFLINNTIASFWIAAYRQQKDILAHVRQQFPTLPTGSTLLLDGVCPYIGPGIVFEANWDVAGALRIFYRDRTLAGDVVKPNLKIKEDGISISIYSGESQYPYKQLFIYNFSRKMSYQLTNAEVTRRYFAKFNPDYSSGCPKGHEGSGTPIF
jgi:hypothetical protein